jgi:hypothetical protein
MRSRSASPARRAGSSRAGLRVRKSVPKGKRGVHACRNGLQIRQAVLDQAVLDVLAGALRRRWHRGGDPDPAPRRTRAARHAHRGAGAACDGGTRGRRGTRARRGGAGRRPARAPGAQHRAGAASGAAAFGGAAGLPSVRGRRGPRLCVHGDGHVSPARRPQACQSRWWPQRDSNPYLQSATRFLRPIG